MMTHCDEVWRFAGFDDDFATHCLVHGWTLADVEAVLCRDATSESPLDWCYSGLDPLEALAAVRDGASCPTNAQLRRLDTTKPALPAPPPTPAAEAKEA